MISIISKINAYLILYRVKEERSFTLICGYMRTPGRKLNVLQIKKKKKMCKFEKKFRA